MSRLATEDVVRRPPVCSLLCPASEDPRLVVPNDMEPTPASRLSTSPSDRSSPDFRLLSQLSPFFDPQPPPPNELEAEAEAGAGDGEAEAVVVAEASDVEVVVDWVGRLDSGTRANSAAKSGSVLTRSGMSDMRWNNWFGLRRMKDKKRGQHEQDQTNTHTHTRPSHKHTQRTIWFCRTQ